VICSTCDHPSEVPAAGGALASATALIERSGARTLALSDWRAELAAVLGENGPRARLLRPAVQGYEEAR
jgi:hypothetical protein